VLPSEPHDLDVEAGDPQAITPEAFADRLRVEVEVELVHGRASHTSSQMASWRPELRAE
jgi:hypothetical protein